MLNALLPMLVTLFGIVILVKDTQVFKADPSIIVTLFGIVILLRDIQ